MTLKVQLLQDAPKEVDQAPLLKFAQWMRKYGDDGFYISFANQDSHESIMDLGCILDGLDEWYGPETEEDHWDKLLPPPPDIRPWLEKEIEAGRCLAWISW